jgi:D-erythro-7,8-dihydroneopterin triphosphate epimerase
MTQQLDKLFINDLTIPCIIGVFPNERKKIQNVIISVQLSVDTQKAGKTDALNDTVSYHTIATDIYEVVSKSQSQLLEKLAQIVATLCLKDRRVKQVKVRIEKPQALMHAKSSAIEIVRENE